jgi:hypothetical protein
MITIEQELFILPSVLYIVILLSFFLSPFCVCLAFFDLLILITPNDIEYRIAENKQQIDFVD